MPSQSIGLLMKKILYILLAAWLVSCNDDPKTETGNGKTDNGNIPPPPKSIGYSIISPLPHDTSSFTEGLLFYKGDLYESTGEYGKSRIMQVDLKTGKIIRSVALGPQYFGEGIVIINDTIYQLTYKEKIGFMYSLKDFKKIGEFRFASPEGWAMTTNGKEIIASDGTSNLYFYEPGTFRLLRTISVTESGSLTLWINELEFIDGYIYANLWQTDYVAKIDPNTGVIVGKINFGSLISQVKAKYPFVDFFNGIAYNPDTKKMYVTGKNWPEMYEIQLGQ
jgi:glutamine cyclotransferase